MNSVMRWNPVRHRRHLINEFDRLFNLPSDGEERRRFGLALDVTENEDGYSVKASVPGINPDDIEITLEDNVLSIKGELSSEEEKEGEQYHIRERHYGSFSRSIRFPVMVNGDAVDANYEHGVLTLSVPKVEEVKPKRITIKA